MIRVDSHNHYWVYNPLRDSWIDDSMSVIQKDFLPETFSSVLKEHNMNGSIAVQADQSEEETQFLLKLSKENDFIKGVVGWMDLRAEDLAEKLNFLKNEQKLCGFRHIVQAEPDDKFLIREDFIRGLKLLNEYNFTYDILIYPHQLKAAIELVNKIPNQRFVLDHIAKPEIKKGIMEPWTAQLSELASAKNVYCKVSGIITEAEHRHWKPEDISPYLDVVFKAFGTDRLMFGSDWPVCLLAGSYTQVVELIEDYMMSFDEEDRQKVFGGNACEFYGINANS